MFEYTVGDTSGASVSQTDGESIYSQLYEYAGIQVTPAYKQDKLGRIDRIKTLFKHNRIFIFNTCVNLIKELPQYQWEAPKHNQSLYQQRPLKVNDHAIDAMSYLIGSRPDRLGLPRDPVKELTFEEKINICNPGEDLAALKRQQRSGVRVFY